MEEQKIVCEGVEKLFSVPHIFGSEADFQFSLAWKMKEIYPDADIRLEYTPWDYDKKIRIDLVIFINNKMIPIELKYKTRQYSGTLGNEKIYLKNQSTQDSARYDFIRDIYRLERITKSGIYPIEEAYAIFLTNDPLYWEPTNRLNTLDSEFRIHAGTKIHGEMNWKPGASKGTIKSREEELPVCGTYDIEWRSYKPHEDCLFKYTIVEIRKEKLYKIR